MIDDEHARGPSSAHGDGAQGEEGARDAAPGTDEARARRDARPHHMIQSDGELLDLGPNAETIDDASTRSTERLDLGAGERGRREPRDR